MYRTACTEGPRLLLAARKAGAVDRLKPVQKCSVLVGQGAAVAERVRMMQTIHTMLLAQRAPAGL